MRPTVRVLTKSTHSPSDVQATVTVRALNSDGRGDGYWAATLVGPKDTLQAEIKVEIQAAPDIRLHAAVVGLEYKTYGRRDLLSFEQEIVLPLSAVGARPAPLVGETVSIQCVPTHILTDIDDIVDVIDLYTKDFRQSGDIVAVAESVVAITQRQYYRPQEVKPGYWAQRLSYFVPSKGSLSSRHGFQLAMNQVGTFKMVSSFFIGFLGKLVGKKGLFYELAGRPAELIDDITGTMPPFDKYIVAGPKDPEAVVARIKERTGMEAAIADANDLKRAMILAATPGLDPQAVSRMLLDNPFGNAAEQTPIVVIRPIAAANQGGAQRDQIRSV
ncbi:F420-0:Gamma-glutamyl ligase [compost metagenome]